MSTNNVPTTPNNFMRTLQIIHMAMISGVLFFGVFSFINKKDTMVFYNEGDVLLYVYPALAIGAVFLGQFLFKNQISSLKAKEDLKEKLGGYQTASIIKFALIEGAAFFGLVQFFTSGSMAYLAITGLLVVYLLLQKPTKTKVASDLDLKGDHRNQFNRFDEEIR